MVGVRSGLAVVVADDGGDDATVATVEARDVAVERKIFAVLVMAAVADAVPDVVEQGSCFELHTGLRRQVVQRLQVIEEHQAKLTDMLRVTRIVIETAGKAARTDEQLPSFGIVTMRFLTGKRLAGNFLKKPFANANGGNQKLADVEVTG